MTEEKKQIAIVVHIIWLLIVIFFMILSRNISLEIFVVLWLIGFLVIMELISPTFVRPSHIRYLKFLMAVGVLVFAYIIILKLMEILKI
jgi:hypothetical protein